MGNWIRRFSFGLGVLVTILCFALSVAQNSGTPGLGKTVFFVVPAEYDEGEVKKFRTKLQENNLKVIQEVSRLLPGSGTVCGNDFWLVERDKKIENEAELNTLRMKLPLYVKGVFPYGVNPNSGFRPMVAGGNSIPETVNESERATKLDDVQSLLNTKGFQEQLNGIKIALLDTGKPQHLSINPKDVIEGFNFSLQRNLRNVGDSRYDQNNLSDLFRPTKKDRELTESKIVGHATGIASLIIGDGFPNNFSGIARGAKILPIKICDGVGECGAFQLATGICKAIQAKVDVINLSISGPIDALAVRSALEAAVASNITVVAAAGNYAPNFTGKREDTNPLRYPVSYALPNSEFTASSGIIGVGAVNQKGDAVANFSRRSDGITVVAPGENIWVASRGKELFVSEKGTSYSTAWVTGLVALLKAQNPTWTPQKIKEHIIKTATPLPNCPATDCGKGLINFPRALNVER